MIKALFLALIAYVASSIDEIPVLYLFYAKANQRDKARTITLAYLTGSLFIVILSSLSAFGLMQVPERTILGWLGIIPVLIGIKILIKGEGDGEEKIMASVQSIRFTWLQVIAVTLAMGVDDLGVFVPLMSTFSLTQLLSMVVLCILGTLILCYISYRLTRIDRLTQLIEKYERFIVGLTFVGIGVYIMLDNGLFL